MTSYSFTEEARDFMRRASRSGEIVAASSDEPCSKATIVHVPDVLHRR